MDKTTMTMPSTKVKDATNATLSKYILIKLAHVSSLDKWNKNYLLKILELATILIQSIENYHELRLAFMFKNMYKMIEKCCL